MPNHVENRIEYSGDARQIRTMLESIKTDEYGSGVHSQTRNMQGEIGRAHV